MIILSQKMRIDLSPHNQKVFQKYVGYSRYIWNKALIKNNEMYHIYRELRDNSNLSKKELNKYYPNANNLYKAIDHEDWEQLYHSRIKKIQYENLEQAWKNFFNPNMPNHRKPRLKKRKDKKDSVTFRGAKIKNGFLYLPKSKKSIKEFQFEPIKLRKVIRFDGELTQDVTIKKCGNSYLLTLSVKNNDFERTKPKTNLSTGVDLNIGKFNYLDKNKEFKELNIFASRLDEEYSRIKYYNKLLGKKRVKNPNWKSSKSYQKVKIKLSKHYTRAFNIQEEIIDQFSSYLLETFSRITIEDLDVNLMKMNKRLCKNLHRSLFGRFRTKIINKSQRFDSQLIIADRFYPSTQRCSSCGNIKIGDDKLGLSGDRFGNPHNKYVCYNNGCGEIFERDENAVLNLIQYSE